MPRWLATMLLAVGLLIGAAFLVDLVLVAARRHRQRLRSRPLATQGGVFTRWRPRVGSGPPAARREPFTGWGSRTGPRPPAPRRKPFTGWEPRIVLADYDRLVVTHCKTDDTVYVLRPPGEDPRAILRVARLVLKEDPYQELAAKLGVPANWPME